MNCNCKDDENFPPLDDRQARRALKAALKTRQFEIQMFWRRSLFFWGFITVAAAGYGALVTANPTPITNVPHIVVYQAAAAEPSTLAEGNQKAPLKLLSIQQNSDESQAKERIALLRLVLVCFGLVCSIAWVLVNLGSKLWQENWEKNVGALEGKLLGGPFFTKRNIGKTKCGACRQQAHTSHSPLKTGGPFSVSGITILLSIFTTLLWMVVATYEAFPVWKECQFSLRVVTLVLTGLMLLCFFCLGRSRLKNWEGPDISSSSKEASS